MSQENHGRSARGSVFSLGTLDGGRWDDFMRREGSVFCSLDWIRTSYRWLQSQGRTTYDPLFFIVEEDGAICAACAVLDARLLSGVLTGRFLIQGHPAVRSDLRGNVAVVDALFGTIEREARRRRVLSVEWECLWSEWDDREGLVRNGYDIRELGGLILDIGKDEAEVHRGLRSSHKSLKNQAAKKHGVVIRESNDADSLYRLWNGTYERAGQTMFSSAQSYLSEMYQALAPKGMARLLFAEREGERVCGAIILRWSRTLYYWHAGSVSGQRFGASHLLQWTVITEGIRQGYTKYHLGGSWKTYADEKSRKQAENIDLFKKGFGAAGRPFFCGGKVLAPLRHGLYRHVLDPVADVFRSRREQSRRRRASE